MLKTTKGLLIALIASVSITAGAADTVQIADNAPDSYVVKKGDTLWAISGMFLKQPWRWPEVWRMNKEQIRNPHLIYPGQVVVLDRNGPSLSLGRGVTGPGGTEKVQPQVYSKDAETPISTVSIESIRSFLVEPLVDETGDTESLPTVVAIQEQRVIGGTGDVIFAKNLPANVETWHVYRRGQAIKDPTTEETLGYEAQFVATAKATTAGSDGKAAALRVLSARQEISPGDRLAPAGKSELVAFPPHAPAAGTTGQIASVYGGVGVTGRYGVITLNRGKNDSVEPGHVVALSRNRGTITYRDDGKREDYELPDDRFGLAYVFRVFNRLSYALVMDSEEPVAVGDKVTAP